MALDFRPSIDIDPSEEARPARALSLKTLKTNYPPRFLRRSWRPLQSTRMSKRSILRGGDLLASPPGCRGARTTGGGSICVGKYPCILQHHDARGWSRQRAGASVRALPPPKLRLAFPTMGCSVHTGRGESQSTTCVGSQSHICRVVHVQRKLRTRCLLKSFTVVVPLPWNPCCVPINDIGGASQGTIHKRVPQKARREQYSVGRSM